VGGEMSIPQQHLTSGQQPYPCPIKPRVPSPHDIVLPCLHKGYLPYHSTCGAESQQGPRSFPEYLRNGPVPPIAVQIPKMDLRPRKNGETKKDLPEKVMR